MFLEGERIYLREVRVEDVEGGYHRWMNDAEVTRYLESRFFPHSAQSLREYVAEKTGDRRVLFLAIVLKQEDRHIGNIKLGPIDWIHRLGDIGVIVGEKDCWGHGYATEAIALVADHAFHTFNLHKLTAGCYASNPGSARAFEKAGFVMEGVRKAHYFSDGAYVDLIMLSKTRVDGT